jgi:hypothetical protein
MNTCRDRFSARLLAAFALGTAGVFFAVLGSTQADLRIDQRIRSSLSANNVTAESCNGRDDDGDGQIDEDLGTFSAGLGVCRTTVPACTNGTLGIPTPGAPSNEVSNGLDDNCNGEVDELGSSAVHVSPTGSDSTGTGTANLPFRTIQVAINFAAANGPPRVYVAAGATCLSSVNYTENVVMANGISVYGNYQATGTNWPRCAGSVTRIVSSVAEGFNFRRQLLIQPSFPVS